MRCLDKLCSPWCPQGRSFTCGDWWNSERSQALRKGRCFAADLPLGWVIGGSYERCGKQFISLLGAGAGWKGLCCWLEVGDAAFLGGTEVRAQYFTPEDLTVVVVTHLRTEEDPPPATKLPPPELHTLPLPEEKPPLRIPPPTPQLPPTMFPPPTTHTPPPRPLPAPKPPTLPPPMVVLPTTAAREGQADHASRDSLGTLTKPRAKAILQIRWWTDTYRHLHWMGYLHRACVGKRTQVVIIL